MNGARKTLGCVSLKWTLIVTITCASSAKATDADASAVVYQLYKDFGWSALFASEQEAARYLGRPIEGQSPSVLEKYFDAELTQLLLNEASCRAQRKGELCNLNFDPIFASQDPAATNLSIRAVERGTVVVRFTYPPSAETVQLKYKLKKHDVGWRVDDIIYLTNDSVSLKAILSRNAYAK
jgi:hypothetical protein